jgi:hypothetical protein
MPGATRMEPKDRRHEDRMRWKTVAQHELWLDKPMIVLASYGWPSS